MLRLDFLEPCACEGVQAILLGDETHMAQSPCDQ